jgi:hypothetical protein
LYPKPSLTERRQPAYKSDHLRPSAAYSASSIDYDLLLLPFSTYMMLYFLL